MTPGALWLHIQSGHTEPGYAMQELSPASYISKSSIGQGYIPDKGRMGEQVARVCAA